MGLEERRMIKELQDVTLPGRVKEIEEICGAPIPYDGDWTSLADDKAGLNFLDNISCRRLNIGFVPVPLLRTSSSAHRGS
jgi:hypothetical protein